MTALGRYISLTLRLRSSSSPTLTFRGLVLVRRDMHVVLVIDVYIVVLITLQL